MKILTSLIILLSSLSVFANTKMLCNEKNFAGSVSSQDLKHGRMTLNYNFATAFLYCDGGSETALKDGKTFRCAGMWSFDFRRPDDSVGTPVIAEFTTDDSGQWKVSYLTSHDYGRISIELPCQFEADSQ